MSIVGVQKYAGQKLRTCEGCQNDFWTYPSKTGRYCGRECTHKYAHRARVALKIASRKDPQECNKCHKSFPLASFPLGRKYPGLRCGSCKQPSEETKRRSHLKMKFGMTLEQWLEIYAKQSGRCPICTKALPSTDDLLVCRGRRAAWGTRDWNTDHCHTTGKVRGITCRGCNMGLGAFREDTAAMRRAAEYIEIHRETSEYVMPALTRQHSASITYGLTTPPTRGAQQ